VLSRLANITDENYLACSVSDRWQGETLLSKLVNYVKQYEILMWS